MGFKLETINCLAFNDEQITESSGAEVNNGFEQSSDGCECFDRQQIQFRNCKRLKSLLNYANSTLLRLHYALNEFAALKFIVTPAQRVN